MYTSEKKIHLRWKFALQDKGTRINGERNRWISGDTYYLFYFFPSVLYFARSQFYRAPTHVHIHIYYGVLICFTCTPPLHRVYNGCRLNVTAEKPIFFYCVIYYRFAGPRFAGPAVSRGISRKTPFYNNINTAADKYYCYYYCPTRWEPEHVQYLNTTFRRCLLFVCFIVADARSPGRGTIHLVSDRAISVFG